MIEPCRRRGPRRRDTSRPVTRLSTSARRAALSRIMVTPPDHQDSRDHQLEGLRPGGGAEWTTAKNGGFCEFSKTYRLCATLATSPRGAPRLTCSGRSESGHGKSFNPRNSLPVHRQKIDVHLLHIATPLHGPQNHWGSLAPTKERPLSENQMCCVL